MMNANIKSAGVSHTRWRERASKIDKISLNVAYEIWTLEIILKSGIGFI